MNYKQGYDGKYLMDIKERDKLSNIGDKFDKKQNPSDKDKQEYYDAFIKYLDYVEKYCDKEFRGKIFTYDHIIPQVFVTEMKSENAYKQYLRYSLYCSNKYAVFLKKFIKIENLYRYKTLRLNLLCDNEWLLANYETINKNANKEINLTCGSRSGMTPRDMSFALRELTIIENAPDIKDIDLRDIQPYRMFIMRQLLETLGKNLIGFSSIVDGNNKPIHKFTQVSWDFLSEYSKKSTTWKLSIPFNISSIYTLNRWLNSFVHVGYIYASYIQYYATNFLCDFMCPPKNFVQCFNGKKQHFDWGDFRIENYNALKNDFENYIKTKSKNASVNWLDVNNVGAYIISL